MVFGGVKILYQKKVRTYFVRLVVIFWIWLPIQFKLLKSNINIFIFSVPNQSFQCLSYFFPRNLTYLCLVGVSNLYPLMTTNTKPRYTIILYFDNHVCVENDIKFPSRVMKNIAKTIFKLTEKRLWTWL